MIPNRINIFLLNCYIFFFLLIDVGAMDYDYNGVVSEGIQ